MRLIDADALIKHIPAEEIVSKMAITNAPTIDAVEVVRCQNCKHGYFAGTALYCDKQSRSHAWHKAAINWYCADGERRENEERLDATEQG